tara:strand:+ start:668 stop:1750 length:1083 start_codon:yes stop_codon:yes gene_type:complete
MKKIKLMGLMFYILSLSLFGCSNATFLNKPSVQTSSNVLDQSTLQRAKEAIVLLSVSTNVDPTISTKQNGTCAGVVINDSGHILTNFHCIHRQNFIKAIYYLEDDYELHDVNVIGIDPLADLALLEITSDVKPKAYIKFAEDTEKLAEGVEVYALGHPMGMAWSLTKGIISSNERYSRNPFIKVLQTDAAINKGNSGGPLLNTKGEIIGINVLIVSRIAENAGIGLAIRGDIAKKSFESMLDNGRVDRPAVGVTIMGLINPKTRDKIIKEFPNIKPEYVPNTLGLWVRPGEVPEGLKPYDTIIGVNGAVVNSGLEFSDELMKYNIGDKIKLTIIRKRVYKEVDITLKVLPINADALYPKP